VLFAHCFVVRLQQHLRTALGANRNDGRLFARGSGAVGDFVGITIASGYS
jgi:hypothetical protein